MAAYSEFAGYYDALMDDVDYPAWADYYLKLIESAGVRPGRICECACGTGAMSVQFAARGVKVIASDISESMLEQAQRRAREWGVQVMFTRQDMRSVQVPRSVDALVCACDGVNYLTDDESLNGFFARAHDCLKPGGALAFDISSEYKLKSVVGENFFGEDRDDLSYLWFNRYDPETLTVTMELTFFVREPDGRYRRFDETHVQKAHAPGHIEALLKQNGFENVRIFGDKTFADPGDKEQRVHFIATRKQN